MLAESHRLDPAAGALLALGRCHERAGRVATAWVTYRDAAAFARRAGDARREAAARNQLELLGPRIPRLVIRLDAGWEKLDGVVVERNGVRVWPREVGLPVLVDPGPVLIEARAEDQPPRRRRVEAVEAQTIDVTLPSPDQAVTEAGAADGGAGTTADGIAPPPLASWVAGAFGLAGAGIFVGFGLGASSAATTVEAQCPERRCPESVRSTAEAGERDQLVANIGLGVGIAGVVTAAILWAAWPDDDASAATTVNTAPAPGDGPGASLSLRF